MYSQDQQSLVEVKIEHDEEEHLPRKFPRLLSNSTSEVSLVEPENGYTSLLRRVSEMEKNLDSDKEHIRVLENSNSAQRDQITRLEKGSNDFIVENKNLRQLLQLQQDEIQQLKKQFTEGLKSEADSRVGLDSRLNNSLNTKTTTLTTMFNERYRDLQSSTSKFQAQLTATEQQHNQELLTKFRILQMQVSSLERTFKNHKHDYTDSETHFSPPRGPYRLQRQTMTPC